MKKQDQKQIKPGQMVDMVNTHKMKEVAPPAEANRGMDGKYGIDKVKAAQLWVKQAKGSDPSGGFNGVPSETLEVKETQDRQMLYKCKK